MTATSFEFICRHAVKENKGGGLNRQLSKLRYPLLNPLPFHLPITQSGLWAASHYRKQAANTLQNNILAIWNNPTDGKEARRTMLVS
ncbi:hypothetical protein TDB9533_00052 [Thalassocella blandensis]|nr:hypothetical protein TDB9533_00052 [Thalassocella blandensis]